jgi:hypothetical protein
MDTSLIVVRSVWFSMDIGGGSIINKLLSLQCITGVKRSVCEIADILSLFILDIE